MIDGDQTVKDAFRGEFFEPLIEAVSDLRKALDIGIFGGNIAYMVKRREFQRGDIGFFGAECFKAEVKDKIREAGIHLIFQEAVVRNPVSFCILNSLHKHSLSIYYIPGGTVLDAFETAH